MAIGAITGVLMRLLAKHGVSRGVRAAQKLGFKNKDIKKAFLNINAEQKRLGLKEFKHKPKDYYKSFKHLKEKRRLSYEMRKGTGKRSYEGFDSYQEMMQNNPFGSFGR